MTDRSSNTGDQCQPNNDSRYPIKVSFHNDLQTCYYFVTRELEPLYGTPAEKRALSDDELDTISQAVTGRQRTQIVIRNEEEYDLVTSQLKTFRDGIASPSGAEWASSKHRKTINRVLTELEAEYTDS